MSIPLCEFDQIPACLLIRHTGTHFTRVITVAQVLPQAGRCHKCSDLILWTLHHRESNPDLIMDADHILLCFSDIGPNTLLPFLILQDHFRRVVKPMYTEVRLCLFGRARKREITVCGTLRAKQV